MQITSLTDFPSKLAHVHVIKVSFLLEDRFGGWGAGEGGGARGAIKPFTKIILPRNGVSRWGEAPGQSRPWLTPEAGAVERACPPPPRETHAPQLCPQAAPSLQQRGSPCC